jgi:hypothetical protein
MFSFVRNNAAHEPHIFVACFPKSGSTYLSKLLQAMSGLTAGYGCEQYGQSEQDISVRRLARLKTRTVIQQHAKATDHNIRILKARGIRPIIHLRNLADVVVSIRDHFYREDHRSPTGFVHSQFWQLSASEQFDYIIQIHLPWYFNFLVSWHEAEPKIPLIVTRYEDLVADRVGVLRRIAEFHNLPTDDRALTSAIQLASLENTRFNRGIVGRGQHALSKIQRDAITQLARVWGLDNRVMTRVGIDLGSMVNSAA